jgi:hypothetical protein
MAPEDDQKSPKNMFLKSVMYVIVFRKGVIVVISVEVNINTIQQDAKVIDITGVLWCVFSRQNDFQEL